MSIASEIEELLRDIERWPIGGGGTTDRAVILLLRAELERQTLAQRREETAEKLGAWKIG